MKLASISFDRQVYVIQNGPMEFVVELGFLAPMKAGILNLEVSRSIASRVG